MLIVVPAIPIMLLLAVIAGPAYFEARKQSRQNQCLLNLRLICRPFLCLTGLEAHVVESTDWKDPREAFRVLSGGTIPKCPSGGDYEFLYVDGALRARCTRHGDLVAQHGDPDEPLKRNQGTAQPSHAR